jgi:hypothetical protein
MHAQPFEKRYLSILSLFPVCHPTIVSTTQLNCAIEQKTNVKQNKRIYKQLRFILIIVNIIAPRFLCTSSTLLTHSLQQVIEDGGEGIILRKPQSHYLPGRSVCLLKIKVNW